MLGDNNPPRGMGCPSYTAEQMVPLSAWIATHALCGMYVFVEPSCSLCDDLAHARYLAPLAAMALTGIDAYLYFRTFGSDPGYWDEADAVVVMEAGGVATPKHARTLAQRPNGGPSAAGEDSAYCAGGTDPESEGARLLASDAEAAGHASPPTMMPPPLPPLRTKFCRTCRRHVLRHDHHCPFMGTCIGLKNHRRFWIFILVQTVLTSYGLHATLTCFRSADAGAGRLHRAHGLAGHFGAGSWASINAAPLVVATVQCVALAVLYPLLLFHAYLICTNRTSYELLARRKVPYLQFYPEDVNPFDRGCVGNVRAFARRELDTYLPTLEEIDRKARDAPETWWENRAYSCLG